MEFVETKGFLESFVLENFFLLIESLYIKYSIINRVDKLKYNPLKMKLTKDAVKHVAKLANLPLTEEEEEKYSKQLSEILEYIDQLNSVNTKNVEPTFNVSGQENVMSKDELGDCTIPSDDALSNASKKENGFFVTKGVFQEE